MSIDNGQPYKWMLENLFPELRCSLAIYAYEKPALVAAENAPDSAEVQPAAETIGIEPQLLSLTDDVEDTAASAPAVENISPVTADPFHRIAIKTNLLYDAALLPNLEVEWLVNNNWSVALEGGVAWWGKYANEKSYRLAMVSPEVKRWLLQRAPWHGLYVGAFAGAGLYDLEKPGRNGYRGEGVMGGLSVGYMWPISRSLSFEAAVGAGYLFTRYKEYEPIQGHHVYQRTKNLNYFGPLKVKFSLVWRLWDINKRARSNNQTLVQYEK